MSAIISHGTEYELNSHFPLAQSEVWQLFQSALRTSGKQNLSSSTQLSKSNTHRKNKNNIHYTHTMPNLVGLRDMPSVDSMEQAKLDTLVAMQMEALGLKRRDRLSTTDFKENTANYVSTVELESRRLVNNGRISKGEKTQLEGWNSKKFQTNNLVVC